MTHWELIDEAVALAAEIEEAMGIEENNASIKARVLDWYNHTDVCDAEMLAAASMHGSFQSVDYNTLCIWHDEYFFPMNCHANIFSIGEIEDSYRDKLWR